MKSNPHSGIVILGLLLVVSSFEIEARVGSLYPPQCDPKYEGTMPDAIKNLCKSVAKLWEMSNDMEDDLDQNGKNFNMMHVIVYWTTNLNNQWADFSRRRMIVR